ncbi:hypothetical protein AAF712_007731 [Marasmius tenuissimus]|uniref:Glutamine amidotransferase type-2 domain-containing protein n=1 Tax=Marasmius tenuissimus TaxID=585030 RepID=A0ABR2ZU58_9AGAR
MCRWFAYISEKEPALLEDVLIRPDHSIVKQVEKHYLPKLFHHVDKESDKEQRADIAARNLYFNGDGTGVAFYTPVASSYGTARHPLPQSYKTTMPPTNDINFRSLCSNTCSTTIFAHVRMATSDVHQFNSHPFTFGRHIFMHNGVSPSSLRYVERWVRRWVRRRLAMYVGQPDSECLAGVYMTHLTGPNEDWDKEYTLEEMKTALEKAIADVFEVQTQLVPGATRDKIPASSLNLCTTDGNKNTGDALDNDDEQPPSLYTSTTAGITLNRKFPGHPNFTRGADVPMNFAAGLLGNDTVPAEEHKDHLIISSEPTTRDDEEWTLVPKNEAVMVQFDADGNLDWKTEKIDIPGFEGV